jgi:hypothetical protein
VFNNTKDVLITLYANRPVQRNFFSHNGVPSEWRGIVNALKPEVHVERNARGKLVRLCAHTYFRSQRIYTRRAHDTKV